MDSMKTERTAEEKLQVLAKIAHVLNQNGITWAVGASLLLWFKGIVPHFNDLDIMVEEADALKAKAALCTLGQLQPGNSDPAKYKTRHFYEFVINGVDVDMMAGFVIVNGGKAYECPLLEEDICEKVPVNGETVPLQSLTNWERYYRLMGREQKADLVKAYLQNKI